MLSLYISIGRTELRESHVDIPGPELVLSLRLTLSIDRRDMHSGRRISNSIMQLRISGYA